MSLKVRDDHRNRSHSSNRSRLRYKEKRKRSRTRSPRRNAKRGDWREECLLSGSDQLDADDEAFYGSEPAYNIESSLANNFMQEDFKERLFDALADDEGRDFWHKVYGQPIDDMPADREMSDDEYAAYVRRGMWERTHADQIEDRRLRESQEQQSKAEHRKFIEQEERLRGARTSLLTQQRLQSRWKQYLMAWEEMGTDQHDLTTFPWPTLDGTITKLTTADIKAFLAYAGDVKTMAREELRRRWHPDRYQQKTQKYVVRKDQVQVLAGVTSVAQSLNEIIAGSSE